MLVNELTTYESWEFKKQTLPHRSRLFQLEPVGLNTPLVESLTAASVSQLTLEIKVFVLLC